MKARGLAEAEELVVYEAILDVVELINVLHNFLTLFRYKVLDKSVSANGNPKANVAVVYKGLGGEQRTEVGEGGISSKQALCGRVRLSRRDTPDKNLGLVVDVQASVVLENQLDVREHLDKHNQDAYAVAYANDSYIKLHNQDAYT